jgi:hypothetical protein
MEGTLFVIADGKAPDVPKDAGAPAGKTPAGGAGAVPSPKKSGPSTSSTPDTTTNNTLIGAIVGSLLGGSVLTIGCYILYKCFKDKKTTKDSGNNYNNPGQVLGDNYNAGQTFGDYGNHGNSYYNPQSRKEPGSEIPSVPIGNDGQEVPIYGNDNNVLQDYIVRIVRQEMHRNNQ